MVAVRVGDSSCVEALIKEAPYLYIDRADADKQTALMIAVRKQLFLTARAIVGYGAYTTDVLNALEASRRKQELLQAKNQQTQQTDGGGAFQGLGTVSTSANGGD